MISYRNIGHFGRLGNQMFQFASTYGIAKKLGVEPWFPIENTTKPSIEQFKDGVIRNIVFDIPKIFPKTTQFLKPTEEIVSNIKQEYSEYTFHFQHKWFEIPDGTNIQGYFQSEKYFEHCINDVKTLFEFDKLIYEKAMDNLNSLHIPYETISIHIRRGDYVNLSEFHKDLFCATEYYKRATSIFDDKNYMFLIFSDDISFCKRAFGEQENIFYIYNNEPEVDLCMMSLCDHNIIANSSFSWWGAWLNKNTNKKVIAPRQWFGKHYEHDPKDIYCKEWIIK